MLFLSCNILPRNSLLGLFLVAAERPRKRQETCYRLLWQTLRDLASRLADLGGLLLWTLLASRHVVYNTGEARQGNERQCCPSSLAPPDPVYWRFLNEYHARATGDQGSGMAIKQLFNVSNKKENHRFGTRPRLRCPLASSEAGRSQHRKEKPSEDQLLALQIAAVETFLHLLTLW